MSFLDVLIVIIMELKQVLQQSLKRLAKAGQKAKLVDFKIKSSLVLPLT